jgi:YHS domain-containing protein
VRSEDEATSPAITSSPCMRRRRLRYIIEDLAQGEPKMEKDVVCGMQVDPAKAAGSSQYAGKTYYFCSKGCKAKFDANPGQFVK